MYSSKLQDRSVWTAIIVVFVISKSQKVHWLSKLLVVPIKTTLSTVLLHLAGWLWQDAPCQKKELKPVHPSCDESQPVPSTNYLDIFTGTQMQPIITNRTFKVFIVQNDLLLSKLQQIRELGFYWDIQKLYRKNETFLSVILFLRLDSISFVHVCNFLPEIWVFVYTKHNCAS